jgi:hypothetical protein
MMIGLSSPLMQLFKLPTQFFMAPSKRSLSTVSFPYLPDKLSQIDWRDISVIVYDFGTQHGSHPLHRKTKGLVQPRL